MNEDILFKNESNLNETQLEYRLIISTEDESNLQSIYSQIVDFVQSESSEFIWNNERLSLPENPVKANNYSYYICEGHLDFGDNLEDEWFVVYLLIQITSKFKGKVSAQINDSDGEFLLIHCANYLPEWSSSAADNQMKNRVHLFNGELHIIPPASTPAQVTYLPGTGEIADPINASHIVFSFPELTKAANPIQEFLNKKISNFNNPKTYLHKQTCTLPTKLVWLLRNNPGIINIAVNRFCDKDPDDLKQCRILKHFKPTNLIDYQVNFTKHLYGKLKCCDYKPDKRHEWPMLNSKTQNSSAKIKQRSILGFKLTCAFEILINQLTNNKSDSFDQFIAKLQNLGFFRGYLENSAKYLELMELAKISWNESSKNNESSNEDLLLRSVYKGEIPDEVSMAKLKEELKSEDWNDDSDEWLCVEPPQLDDYLDMYSKGEVSSVYDFKLVADAFKQFLQPKREDLLKGVDFGGIETGDENLVEFDPECIEKNLKELLNEERRMPDEEETDSFYEVDEDLLDDDIVNDKDNNELKDYMKSMDEELNDLKELSRIDCTKGDEDLNIDLNLVSNALESYSSQMGLTGPVSNILKSLGI